MRRTTRLGHTVLGAPPPSYPRPRALCSLSLSLSLSLSPRPVTCALLFDIAKCSSILNPLLRQDIRDRRQAYPLLDMQMVVPDFPQFQQAHALDLDALVKVGTPYIGPYVTAI